MGPHQYHPDDRAVAAPAEEGAAAPDRREFLRGTLRLISAGAVLGATGLAVSRAGAARCFRPNLCGECPVFGGCERPRAVEYREAHADAVTPSILPAASKGGRP